LLSDNKFIAIGSHHNQKLFTYRWKGNFWAYKTINQDVGQYYYYSINNFLLSLDEDVCVIQ